MRAPAPVVRSPPSSTAAQQSLAFVHERVEIDSPLGMLWMLHVVPPSVVANTTG